MILKQEIRMCNFPLFIVDIKRRNNNFKKNIYLKLSNVCDMEFERMKESIYSNIVK